MIRRFAIIGQRARAGGDFLLDDLPGTSGRLDVLVRSLRAALLTSHGLRRDAMVYLVLLGGPRAPRVVRVDGAEVRFLRPDERSLAVLMKKVLATDADDGAPGFVEVKPGISVARGDFDAVLADASQAMPFLLEEVAPDIRALADDEHGLAASDILLVIGDHLGIPDPVRARLAALGAGRISIGPVAVHADDVVAIVSNELDRRAAAAAMGSR